MGDRYGIGATIEGCAEVYFRAARHTGRTSNMIASLKDGDTAVFFDAREANRVRELCLVDGVKISVIVLNRRDCLMPLLHSQFRAHKKHPGNRIVLDHGVVEEVYAKAIDSATKELASVEKALNPGLSEPQSKPTGFWAY